MAQLARLIAALLVLLTPAVSGAAFHFTVIDEVMSGIGADPAAQYVEIRMLIAAQTFVAHSRLTAFSCDGTSSQILLEIPGNVAGGMDRRWLIATSSFQTAVGIAPDFTFSGSIPTPCGMVCWGAPGAFPQNPPTWDATNPNNYTDCVAYGGYSGTTKTLPSFMGGPTSGTPTTLAPGDGTSSLTRVSRTNNNVTDFMLAAPTPTNNAGMMPGGGTTTTTMVGATTTTVTGGSSTTTTLPGQRRRSKCTSRKLLAAGIKASAKAACQAKAVAKGITVEAACNAAAEAAFRSGWTKAEARQDCLAPAGDQDAIEVRVDAFVLHLVGDLVRGSGASKCTSKKLRTAGKTAFAETRCSVKALGKPAGADAACLRKVVSGFRAAWSRAERRADCQAPTGDFTGVGGRLDVFIAGLRGALVR